MIPLYSSHLRLNFVFAAYQKHSTPSLDDPVWRLKKISKQGASHLKLEKIGIKTVKDFLVQYHINSLHLRNVRTLFSYVGDYIGDRCALCGPIRFIFQPIFFTLGAWQRGC